MAVRQFICLSVINVIFTAAVVPTAHGAAGSMADPALAKLHPTLQSLTELPDSAVRAWVFFTDKSLFTEADCAKAIEDVAVSYNVRATQRRALRRTVPGLFDERDIPVAGAYLDAVARMGARLHVASKWLNGTTVSATSSELVEIARLPFVRSIEPVHRTGVPALVQAGSSKPGRLAENAADFYGRSYDQLSQINVIALHQAGYTGADVVIGVLDTGFRKSHVAFNHPEHPLQIVAEWDFLQNDADTQNAPDEAPSQHEHGTYILGTLAAYVPGELVGAAYEASYILCKVEDAAEEYYGEEDLFVAGLEYIEANGGDVATSSVVIHGGYAQNQLDGLTSVMTLGVNVATENGVHVCQGGGNDGHDTNPSTSRLVAPADAFDAVTVGAVQSDGNIAGFSSDGPTADGRVKPEVLARGVDVWTASPGDDTGYVTVSGTSLSTPQVAGAVACLLQARPKLTVEQMRTVLFKTADYYVEHYSYDPTYVRGYGLIDAFGPLSRDCNGNGVLDPDDIAGGTSTDYNGNNRPDECDLPADFDGNDLLDLRDLRRFRGCMYGPATSVPRGCLMADPDRDQDVDLADFAAVQNAFTG